MEKDRKGASIGLKSFLTSILIIFLLMVLTYALTFLIPAGEYSRVTNEAGQLVIDTSKPYRQVEADFGFTRWLLSPFLVLGAEGSGTIIAVIIFLLVIGGVFNSLDKSGLMRYMLDKIIHRYHNAKYKLMALVVLFFMALGTMVGSFEEVVPMVPIVVALSVGLGWDVLTGIAMSLLATGCGFAAGVCNPFTIGVAQELAGLPMFSGIWLRLLSFGLVYALLLCYIRRRAVKSESYETAHGGESDFAADEKRDRGLKCFAIILGLAVLLVMSSAVLTFLQDFTMIIIALMFLAAGIVSVRVSGMSGRELWESFMQGLVGILPAVLMILMASSVKYTLQESKILDTLLYAATGAAADVPKSLIILLMYYIALVMNFFIASGSAKAFLLIPLFMPIAQLFGISPQLVIVAYAFGDGFSNVFYPTNPVLLISLGLTGTGYGKWAKYCGPFMLLNLLLTSLILIFGFAVGY